MTTTSADNDVRWDHLPMGWCGSLANGVTIEEATQDDDDPAWCVFDVAGELVSTHQTRDDAVRAAQKVQALVPTSQPA